MLEAFRSFFRSKFGTVVSIGVLVLIALAFASGDLANTGGFGTGGSSGQVATVGKATIDTTALSQSATNALENVKRENPRMSMQAFLAAKGLDRVLDDLIGRTAIWEFGRQNGIVAGDRLIDSEIAKMPSFQGPDGKFSDDAFRQALQQRGLSEQLIREDIAQGLLARQILLPAGFGASVPGEFATRYAGLLRERRVGAIAVIPSPVFMPDRAPGDTEVTAWYTANRSKFIRPERRTIRYAEFGDSVLKAVPAATEAEIVARYAKDKALYAALETRGFTQLIVPTEAAAQAVVAELGKGTPLDAAAKAKGLSTASLPALSKQTLTEQASQAVADAAFAASRGAIAAPARSGLGWHVMRVDTVDSRSARSLDQARTEITGKLATEKRRAALDDMTARLEEELEGGGTLTEVAKDLGLTVQQSPSLTADGAVYGLPGQRGPQQLAPALQAAFAMERENQPQLAVLDAGKRFMVFDVSAIESSSPAPLAEIRKEIEGLWRIEQGSIAAKAAAQKVQAAVQKGASLQNAMAAAGKPLPPVQPVNMGREQLAQAQQVAPPLTLLFSMAKRTVKVLPADDNRGWFVVWLESIEPQPVRPGDPVLAAAQRQLGQISGSEYAEQLRNAIQKQVGVERNAAAIGTVRKQLGGEGN